MKKKKIVILGIVILLVLLAFIPTEVTYQITEPTQVQKPLLYRVVNKDSREGLSGLNWIIVGTITIENIDSEPGTFIVNCEFRTVDRTLRDSSRVYVIPGETKTASCQGDIIFRERGNVRITYDIVPGTKTVTEMKTVTKKKTVRIYQAVLGLY